MLTRGFVGKSSAVARLVTMSAVGGVLMASILLPVVGGLGVAARNASNKFQNLSANLPAQLPERSQLLDAKGHVLAYFYGHIYGQSDQIIDRVPVSFSQIAPVMRQAIIAIEDARFYQHGGIDFKGTVRAALQDLHGGSVQGGSTIAQQYVKNVLILTAKNAAQAQAASSDTVGRKIRELRYAVAVEHQMTKDQLLAAYLNLAYFGQQAYGVQVAAERYFSSSAANLTLPQAALLAGIVENPAAYDPMAHPASALARRNIVITRMAQLHWISPAQAAAAQKAPLMLAPSAEPNGCVSSWAPFFCDYVISTINNDAAFSKAKALLNGIGGLTIHTTLNPRYQYAAQRAVDYELPAHSSAYNPGRNADTEVLIQPGTGYVRALAIDRPYGTGPGQTVENYAVEHQYNGGEGVQIGSTGKVYVMVAALLQGIPFGFSMSTPQQITVTGYTNCKGQAAGYDPQTGVSGTWSPHNDESEGGGTHTLYTGTTYSINTFFAKLEQRVGLCNVVKTAAQMGLVWPDGASLLRPDPLLSTIKGQTQESADNNPSFTLGADQVAPIDVAAADAVLPARGIYCHPTVVEAIADRNGRALPVESAGCHRVLPSDVADAANYILQGDLTAGTAVSDAIPGLPTASKTGTADQYTSAFFVGYTPRLLGAVWVGNPRGQVSMSGEASCYREGCPGAMYGSMAPGKTWQMTFQNAGLSPVDFVGLPSDSPFFSKGNGQYVPPSPRPRPGPGGGGGGDGGGGGHGGGHGRPPTA